MATTMGDYAAPLKDMRFALRDMGLLAQVAALPGGEEWSGDLVDAILEEAGKFASGVLSPLNRPGDLHGARWDAGQVTTAPGWKEAYQQFVDGGWNALSCSPEFGGQGLPRLVSALVEEMWNGANLAFTLCPMLTRSAIEAIELRGSQALQSTYLDKLVAGTWTGTMNLTEPQAGSDLAAIRTRSERQADGSYLIFGQKIFITYGDHDLAENIVHLVLARTPDGPPGVKGISLFVVPKFLVNEDGSVGERNDVHCVSLEHKLGIHASPTAVLAYGDHGGAKGWLVGEENRGIETMFIVMNAARYSVGLEGIGIAERAYQRALAYARERVQGGRQAIIGHPDIRRMLLSMKSRIEAMRLLACTVAAAEDVARLDPDASRRATCQAFVDLLIPVVKGWNTETAVDIASLGIQVHGGVGFIEETGAAQYLRDARITPIYEGTTGIQAMDLVGRKIARDRGEALGALIVRMRAAVADLADGSDGADDVAGPDTGGLAGIGRALSAGIDALETAGRFIVTSSQAGPADALAAAVPMLELLGIVAGGWQMTLAATAAHRRLREDASDEAFLKAKIGTSRFYADHVMPRAQALAAEVTAGAASTMALGDEQF